MIHLQSTKSQVLLGPTTAATTTRSASFDWLGADYAVIRVIQSASAGTNGGCSISVLEGDSLPTNATQFSTIVADLTAQATTSHEAVYLIDLKSSNTTGLRKRYGKIILTPTTATNDSIITMAHLVLSRLEQAPTGTLAMVATTNDSVTVVQ